MFKLTNARGETVDINTPSLRSYTPTGLGLQITNSYSPYETYFIPTKSVLSQGIMQVYMKFGDIESQSYQSFSDFAEFLAYQPYTLEYDFDDNTYYRDARLQSLTKTEIGGSTIDAFDRLNEIFTLEFINNWYNNKTAEYKSYDPDPNLGTYGKIYRPKYDPYIDKNLIKQSSGQNASDTGRPYINDVTNTSVYNTKGNIYTSDGLFLMIDNPKSEMYYSLVNAWTPLSQPPMLKAGETYTIGVDVVGSFGYVAFRISDVWYDPQPMNHTKSERVYQQFTIPSDATQFYLRINASTNVAGETNFIDNQAMIISNISLRKSATDWVPAPEDNLAIPFGYAYAPYYVYQESNRPSNEKVMSLNNKSQYFGLQSGSPSVITVNGPCSVNPTWTVVQKGNVVATDGFVLTLTDNQKLVVSSYPEDQYARLYNPDGSYVDVSQLQDYTKTNFVQIPEGESTVLIYVDKDTGVDLTFKEERLLV